MAEWVRISEPDGERARGSRAVRRTWRGAGGPYYPLVAATVYVGYMEESGLLVSVARKDGEDCHWDGCSLPAELAGDLCEMIREAAAMTAGGEGEPSHILVRPLPGKTAAETADVVRRVIEATREREGK